MYISVDIEADGPCPGLYSMIELGAVIIDGVFDKTFYASFKPITENFSEKALSITDVTREQTFTYSNPKESMISFNKWIRKQTEHPMFVSDTGGFDWQFVNYYFHLFIGENPFGYDGFDISMIYKGMKKDIYRNFHHLKDTKHTHNPVDDAKGNAEAFYKMKDELGLIINLK